MRLFLAAAALLSSATASVAADRYHVVTPSFGCVLPWTAWVSNDQRSLRRHAPQWLQHVIERGQCRLVSPIQEWQLIGSSGRLLLLRPLPQQGDTPPLLFRPVDLRRGQTAATTTTPGPEPVAAPPIQAPPASDSDAVLAQALPMVSLPALQAQPASTAPPPASPVASPAAPLHEAPASARASVPTPVPMLPAAAARLPAALVPSPVLVPVPIAKPVVAAPLPPRPVVRPATVLGQAARHAPAPSRIGFVVGAIALVLALLAILAWAAGRRFVRYRIERLATAWPDPATEAGTTETDPALPRIDRDSYRRRCIDFLVEGGWKARPCFPGSGLTADIMARRDGRLLTVQCRPSMQPLEATVVREALVVRAAQDAALAAVVSNAGYTKAARSLAAASGVLLLHETELPELVS